LTVTFRDGKANKRTGKRTEPKLDNSYIALLVELYTFFAIRTDCKFNKVILRRLFMSYVSRSILSLSFVANQLKENEGKIVVNVGTVTDDPRLLTVPKMTVACFLITKTAQARIINAGGEILTLDQFTLRASSGQTTILVRAKRMNREAAKHFGFGPHSHKKPYI
jgi:large subunit ribosomal protein L18e